MNYTPKVRQKKSNFWGVFIMKLTYDDKVQIYELRKQGYSLEKLSNKFGINRRCNIFPVMRWRYSMGKLKRMVLRIFRSLSYHVSCFSIFFQSFLTTCSACFDSSPAPC
ncbi:hypothetical protein AKI51_06325 [Streptococcus pneumoniae]|nr:hypothetical protein AKI51_06325 [Streptococcus pneumoniae]